MIFLHLKKICDHPRFLLSKFDNKFSCKLRLQLHLIVIYWMSILTNPSLDYNFFLYSNTYKILIRSKINIYVINEMFEFQVFVV